MPKAIYSVLGGAASSYKFVKEFPDAANGIIDCNHWFNPKDKRAQDLKKRVEAKNLFFSYELFMTYTAMTVLADAIERAKSADRAAITDALAQSTFADHIMPYVADIAGMLTAIEEARGQPTRLVADGADIQLYVAEKHGAQRARLGWTADTMRLEWSILQEEIERLVRRTSSSLDERAVAEALIVLQRFVEQGEDASCRALARAGEPADERQAED